MKNIIIVFFLVFLYGCGGYSSIYGNQDSQDLQINITKMQGDKDFNNLFKKEINLYSNLNSQNKYDVSVNSKYEKNIISKDSSGVATDYKLLITTKIAINLNGKITNMEFKENINIKNNSNSFEQNNYEKNVKRNFASSIRNKLIIKIQNINDN